LKADGYLKYPCNNIITSSNHKDVLECYRIGIAGYVIKPLKYDDYVDRITKLIEYWSCNELITIKILCTELSINQSKTVITNLEREWDIIHKKKWHMISFLSNEVYDDDVTYKIATAVGE
jgi:DNA-binding NarL/FixJ family response regulator